MLPQLLEYVHVVVGRWTCQLLAGVPDARTANHRPAAVTVNDEGRECLRGSG